jgi:hypothetical protein
VSLRQVFAPAWYRFRATFRQKRGGYLAIVVLLGLVGGIALGAIAGARRTQSSYPVYLASTSPSDLQAFTAFLNPALGPAETRGYRSSTERHLAALPYVVSEQTVVGFDANIDQVLGAHTRVDPGAKPPSLEGAVGTEYFAQDRVTLVSGSIPDPSDPGQAVMNAQAGKELGIHVGSRITVTLNSDAQLLSSANSPPAAARAPLRIVGLVVFPQDVVNDDYDTAGTAEVLVTPALTRRLDTCCATYSYSSIRIAAGHLGTVESELSQVIPSKLLTGVGYRSGAPAIGLANQAIQPESIALALFGAVAALAALVIVGQVIGRQRRIGALELETVRALGAGPATTAADATLGTVTAVVAGALLAAVVAFFLSPLFPLGPVRPVYPYLFGWDWTVLGLGFLAFVVILSAVAIGFALRMAPERLRRRSQQAERASAAARWVASLGLPAPATTGLRFALQPGGSREPVPVRSAILGTVLAITVIVATLTFGSSLNSLIAHPALYGWNWNYALFSGFSGDEDLPAHITGHVLGRDSLVTQFSGAYFSSIKVHGQRLPVIGMRPGAPVQPPLLSGTGLRSADEIVLGANTMANLHTHLGASLEVGTGKGRMTRLVVVGEATMPAIMGPGMGNGALVDDQLIPAAVRNAQGNTIPGPQVFFVRTKGGDSPAALRSLAVVARQINRADSDRPASGPTGVLRPEVIVNSGSIETVPTVLGSGLAAGAVMALGITLAASVRRRRRDFAIMRTLGLSGRQLATIVAWQATVAVAIGGALGVPLGIVAGRQLWDLFAEGIHAIPAPDVPTLVVTAIGVGAIVLANLVAIIPGRIAARTPTASLLRTE